MQTARFELQDGPCYGVEEVAVVGDDEDGALRPLHEALQPLYSAQVEVVGWFVQQDQVRLFEEKTGQRDAALLAARERADGALPVLGGEA